MDSSIRRRWFHSSNHNDIWCTRLLQSDKRKRCSPVRIASRVLFDDRNSLIVKHDSTGNWSTVNLIFNRAGFELLERHSVTLAHFGFLVAQADLVAAVDWTVKVRRWNLNPRFWIAVHLGSFTKGATYMHRLLHLV